MMPRRPQTRRILTVLCCWLGCWLGAVGLAWAGAPAAVVMPGELLPLGGHLDYLRDDPPLDTRQMLAGGYEDRFVRYDHPSINEQMGAVWLRIRLANNTESPRLVLSANDVLYTDARLLYNRAAEGAAPDIVDREVGFLHSTLHSDWPYYDIGWYIEVPHDQVRTVYLRLATPFDMLMDPFASDEQAYSLFQVKRASWGHLMVGIMIGVLLYLAMLAVYVRALREVRHCIAFVSVSFLILMLSRGYLYRFMPDIDWLLVHIYPLLFAAQGITYIGFSRQHFRTEADYPLLDRLLQVITWFAAGLLVASLVLPLGWSVLGISVMAFVFVITLSVCSVYIWANSERPLTVYITGTLAFLFVCIVATAENTGMLDLGGYSRDAYEAGLCLQAALFALALGEKIRDFQNEQTRLAVLAASAKAENRAKSSFLAKMSHELRTPMNGMIGMLQLLERTPLNDQQQHYVQVMRNSGRMLLGVIDDVLDYSRIVAGKLQIADDNFDLAAIAADLESLYAPLARQKGITLRFALNTGKPLQARGDALRLRQILVNLLGNALKFTEKGAVSLRLWIEECDDTVWALHAEVEDTGIGIAPGQLDRLFSDQGQGDDSRNRGGSGLGLVICRQLVRLMNGEMTVDSAPGYGSLFRFHIEVRPPREVEDNPQPAETQAGNGRKRRAARILVAEDNETSCEVLASLLGELGHHAVCVSDGAEALKRFCQLDTHWDLVFMDLEMPVLDGFATVQRLRAWEEKHCRNATPVIALTGHDTQALQERIRQSGMDDQMEKPVELDTLHNTVARWFPYA